MEIKANLSLSLVKVEAELGKKDCTWANTQTDEHWHHHFLSCSLQLKMSQKVEKFQKGGGSAAEIKKSTIQNLDFLNREGGEAIFSFLIFM